MQLLDRIRKLSISRFQHTFFCSVRMCEKEPSCTAVVSHKGKEPLFCNKDWERIIQLRNTQKSCPCIIDFHGSYILVFPAHVPSGKIFPICKILTHWKMVNSKFHVKKYSMKLHQRELIYSELSRSASLLGNLSSVSYVKEINHASCTVVYFFQLVPVIFLYSYIM